METEISTKTRAFIVKGANEILNRQEWPFLSKTILGLVGSKKYIYMKRIPEILKVDKKLIEKAVYSLEKEGLVEIKNHAEERDSEIEDQREVYSTDEAVLYGKSYGNDVDIPEWEGLEVKDAYKIMKAAEPFCGQFNYEKYFYIPIQKVKQLGKEINSELGKIEEEVKSRTKNLEQKEKKYILELLNLPETTEFSRQITNGYFSWKDQTKCSCISINARMKYDNLEDAFKDNIYSITGRAKIGEDWWFDVIHMSSREKEKCWIYLSNFSARSDSLEKPLNSQEIAFNKRNGLIKEVCDFYPEKQVRK